MRLKELDNEINAISSVDFKKFIFGSKWQVNNFVFLIAIYVDKFFQQ